MHSILLADHQIHDHQMSHFTAALTPPSYASVSLVKLLTTSCMLKSHINFGRDLVNFFVSSVFCDDILHSEFG